MNMVTTPNTSDARHVAGDHLALDLADSHGVLDRFSREDIERIQRHGGRGYAYEEPMLWISPVSSEDGDSSRLRCLPAAEDDRRRSVALTPATTAGSLRSSIRRSSPTASGRRGEYVQHEASGNGEKWRIQYEGQDGMGGELAKIRRIRNKRVTAGGARRRNPLRTVGRVPDSTYYTGG